MLIIGAELFSDVLELEDKIKIHHLPGTPSFLSLGGKALFIIFGPLKILFQIWCLFQLLLTIPQPAYILVQVNYSIGLSDLESAFNPNDSSLPRRLQIKVS
jgi:hypothetical protein